MGKPTNELVETLNTRDIRISSPKVIEMSGADNQFAPPGTISLLVAARGSILLGQIMQVLEQPDTKVQEQLIGRVIKDLTETISNPKILFDQVSDIPVLGEVRYGSKSLRQGMFIAPGYEIAYSLIPYNGATLRAEQFQFLEYYNPAARDQLVALVVLSRPTLTDLEKEILTRVNPEWDQIHFVDPGGTWTDVIYEIVTVQVAAAARFVAQELYAFFRQILAGGLEDRFEAVLLEETFNELDENTSAAILLQVRTQLLGALRAKDAAGAARTLLRARKRIAGPVGKEIL
jgi:hypothetical protein